MQRQETGIDQNAYGSRMLSGRGVLSHNRHVSAGTRKAKGCGFCDKGLDGVAPEIKAPEVESESQLAEGDRGNEEEAASSTPDSREYWE